VPFKGDPDAGYDIRWSSLSPPSRGLALEKVQISAGKYITVAGTFAFGSRERAFHMDPDDYASRLVNIGNRFIVLHDTDVRKAWLVDGLSALLHLVRSNLTYDDRNNTYGTATSISTSKTLEAIGTGNAQKMAFETLINRENMNMRLYRKPDKVLKEGQEEDTDFYCVVDAVKYIMYVLEQMIDHQADTSTEDSVGYRIQKSSWKQMQGFDFMDIATKSDTIWSRATKLRDDGEGWVGLTRAIHAPTLFGKGFGELLNPVRESGNQSHCVKCHWNSNVPAQRDILAVSISELERIIERRGSKSDTLWRIVDDIHLNVSTELFSACLKNRGRSCHQQRVQRLQRSTIQNHEKSVDQKKEPSRFLNRLRRMIPRRTRSIPAGRNTRSLEFSTGGVLLGMTPKRRKNIEESKDGMGNLPRLEGGLLGAGTLNSLGGHRQAVAESSGSRTVAQSTDTTPRANSRSTPLTELSRPQDTISSVAIKSSRH
jgi:hypothetical protein